MCGRFVLTAPEKLIAELFGLTSAADAPRSYNIAPTDPVAGIRLVEGVRTLGAYRWGLVPFWAKDLRVGARMINARSETVHTKSAFRDSFASRRLLIVADGFYEWEKVGKTKLPTFFRPAAATPGSPKLGTATALFAFAGLWAMWRRGDEEIRSCTILTTEANPLVARLHDRMPVILPPSKWGQWLDPQSSPEALRGLLLPYPGEAMASDALGMHVNNVRNKGAECLTPRPPSLFE